MHTRRKAFLLAMTILLACFGPVIKAEQERAGDKRPAGQAVTAVTTASSLADLLPDALAGTRATGEIKQYGRASLPEIVGDKAAVYQEYKIIQAASRNYGESRVEVFQSANRFAAFGLFTYAKGAAVAAEEIGTGSARVAGGVIFHKGNYFVRVADSVQKKAGNRQAAHVRLAGATAAAIKPGSAATRPPLLDRLPQEFAVGGSHRYFLGPDALAAYVERARETFEFMGEAEAVMAEYSRTQDAEKNIQSKSAPVPPIATPPRLKLIVIEYHTPHFATDAMERARSYIESLPESEQNRRILKREGNYLVQATGVEDREFAERLVETIKYPYTVKWLRNPLWATNDPFRAQKAASMLVSTFGILGVIILTVLAGGTVFGSMVFLKRRKLQREVFSDAGGMLRLDLDPFETNLLGLPPKKG
jgi:uncharacterized protein DUF6599